MCWHYVPESAVSSSVSTSRDQTSERSATSTETPTPCGSCASGSPPATSTTLPSGMTSEPSTGHPGVDAWISSLRATHASRSQPPVSALAGRTSAGSGTTSGASFATWSRDTCSWKTSQLTFPGLGDESSVTWPQAGGVSNGTAFLRLPWADRMAAIAYSLSLHGEWLQQMVRDGRLAMLAATGLLPTPCRSDAKRSGSAGYSLESGRHGGRTLTDCTVGPARDRGHRRNGPTLTDCVDGPVGARQNRHLNPSFVEWMLGLPAGWTA